MYPRLDDRPFGVIDTFDAHGLIGYYVSGAYPGCYRLSSAGTPSEDSIIDPLGTVR
jgi:hypothetical protein